MSVGRAGLLVAVTFCAGCDVHAAPEEESFRDPEPQFDARVAEVWAVGGVEERGGVLFESGHLRDGAIGPDGSTALVDFLAGSVWFFGPSADQHQKLGRRGSGPGEFQRPDQAEFDGDSVLWVSDMGLSRITWFDVADLKPIKTATQSWEPVPDVTWSARGSLPLKEGAVFGTVTSANQTSSSGRDSFPLVHWDQNGTLNVAGWAERSAPPRERVRTAGGLEVSVPQLVNSYPIPGIASSGNWFFVLERAPPTGSESKIEIQRYAPGGDLIDVIEIGYEPVELTDTFAALAAEKASGLAQLYRKNAPQFGELDAAEVEEAMWIPEFHPPVQEVFADSQGFWLEREAEREMAWERYDLDGRLLARVKLPESVTSILAADATGFVGYGLDSLDVPIARKFEVELVPRVSDDQ